MAKRRQHTWAFNIETVHVCPYATWNSQGKGFLPFFFLGGLLFYKFTNKLSIFLFCEGLLFYKLQLLLCGNFKWRLYMHIMCMPLKMHMERVSFIFEGGGGVLQGNWLFSNWGGVLFTTQYTAMWTFETYAINHLKCVSRCLFLGKFTIQTIWFSTSCHF